MDLAMDAIVMQHRALQACNSCRKLKRKCTYNPTLGKCDRCSESGKPCVYAEVNSTTSHSGSTAAPDPSTSAVPSGTLIATPQHHDLPVYLNSYGAPAAAPDRLANIVYDDQRNALSDGSRMAFMGSGNEDTTYPSGYAGRQF